MSPSRARSRSNWAFCAMSVMDPVSVALVEPMVVNALMSVTWSLKMVQDALPLPRSSFSPATKSSIDVLGTEKCRSESCSKALSMVRSKCRSLSTGSPDSALYTKVPSAQVRFLM